MFERVVLGHVKRRGGDKNLLSFMLDSFLIRSAARQKTLANVYAREPIVIVAARLI